MRLLVPVSIGLVALACGGSGSGADPAEPFNVLLVTLDTTRADRLGCYGYARQTSPRLDRFAGDAARFETAISTSAITPISHASIFTGLNPDRHGLRVFYGPVGHVLDPSHPTLASILSAAGWNTAAFISAYPASERFGLDHGFETFENESSDVVMTRDPSRPWPREGYFLRERNASAQRRADATTDQALAWLDEARGPWFAWVHYFDPHDPWLVPPEEITERFGVEPDDPDAIREIYDPEVYFMDSQFGRLLDRLRETGAYDRTIIVVVADHGQGLGDHGWFAHRLLYQEQIRVPLLVRVPGEPAGVVVDDLVRTIDVLPTILEAAGRPIPVSVEGKSLLGLMRGEDEPARTGYAEALSALDTHAPPTLPSFQRDLLFAVVTPDWKLIYHHENPQFSELYDLSADPAERDNVVGEFSAQARALLERLEQSGAMTIRRVDPGAPMEPEALEKLRSLGYIGN